MNSKPILAIFGLLVLVTQQARSSVSFSFNYSDPSASNWSLDARDALATAANQIASYLTGYNAVITMQVTGSNADSTSLASAGSYYANLTPGFNNIGVVGTKIQSNGAIDYTGANFDGVVDANFFHPWSFTNTVSGSQYDFVSVMMHELSHAMGFSSLIEEDGSASFSSSPSAFSPWDEHLVNGANQLMVNPGTLTVDLPKWQIDSVGGTGTMPATVGTGLYFNGPNAVAANGGNLIPIYSPAEWENGSSGSHLDTDFYTGPGQKLMNHAVTTGLGEREFSEIEIGIFRDLGYAAFAIPEPSSALLAAMALGLGLGMRRKRQAA